MGKLGYCLAKISASQMTFKGVLVRYTHTKNKVFMGNPRPERIEGHLLKKTLTGCFEGIISPLEQLC